MRTLMFAMLFFAGTAAAQVPLVEAHVMADDFAEAMLDGDELFAGCSLGCAYGWSVEASSHLAPQGANRYDAERLEDFTARTAWVEGVDGDGVGEWLLFTIEGGTEVDGEPFTEPVSFWGIDLVNGYAKTEATWEANGRVRELLLSLNGDDVCRIRLEDTRLPQSIALDAYELQVAPGDQIRLEITAVYPGARYADTALTELVLHGAH